jgi:murein DD-endopeptidase MepM/ murein hydrolase activator NlpD
MSRRITAAGMAAFLLLGLAAPGAASSADLGCDDIRTDADLPFTRQLNADSFVTGSLADSAAAAGVPAAAMAEVLRALGTAIDLDRDVKNGDRFHVRYEESFSLTDEPTGNARVLWAELRTKARGTIAVHRFRTRDGDERFWLAGGKAAAAPAIQMPLDIMTVTSGFGWRTDPLDHPPGPLANMVPPAPPAPPPARIEPTPEEKAAAVKDQQEINRAYAGFGNGEQLGSARDVTDRAKNNDLDRIMAEQRARRRRAKEEADRAEAEAAAKAAARPVVATPSPPAAPPKLFMHEGLDLLARTGTPVHAAADGTVIAAGPNGGYGNWVRLAHDGHLTTVYGHLSAFAYGIEKGATVKRGDIIGLVGSTGRSTGAHLHFELLVDARPVDPRNNPATHPAQLAGFDLARFNRQVAASLAQRDREAAMPELNLSLAKTPVAKVGRDAF